MNCVDSFHTPGQEKCVIVLEFCPCKFRLSANWCVDGDLSGQAHFWKQQRKAVPEDYVLGALAQLLQAVGFAHSLDVFH